MKNHLLKNLPESELSLIRAGLRRVELSPGDALYETNEKISHVYFPEDSMISLISTTRDGLTVEVGVVGPEGFLGADAMLDRQKSPYQATVQAGGSAYRVEARALRKVFRKCGHLQEQMLAYFLVVHTQVAQSAICNKFHTVAERLAKWLLLSVDRSGKLNLDYTHEFLSMMLGVRRTTVTRALKSLQRLGLIRRKRSSITVLDVKKLAAVSCECYEIILAELNSLSNPTAQ